MPQDFHAVPDWFSHENQGAGVAVANIAGLSNLVVLMVDDAPQQNRGLYRIGRDLSGDGAVAGGGTPWIDVPPWFSWQNQGADVAVADLAGGGPDLVVLMVDNPPELNAGLYKVGRGVDADGAVTGGWSDWQPIPGWFSWANSGGGVAVADVGGTRRATWWFCRSTTRRRARE